MPSPSCLRASVIVDMTSGSVSGAPPCDNARAVDGIMNGVHESQHVTLAAMANPREQRLGIDAADMAQGLQILVAIADLGSFTAAGERLGLTPSAISKAVAKIEARLGVRLLQRTTRRVALTELGEAYVTRGRRVLADLEGLEREASARDGTVRGMLRVSAPALYGALKVAPRIVALQRKHPALDVHFRCEDRLLDLVAERIDVAVRIMVTPPVEFVARVVGYCEEIRLVSKERVVRSLGSRADVRALALPRSARVRLPQHWIGPYSLRQ